VSEELWEEMVKSFAREKLSGYRFINPKKVVVEEWVRLKCQFGCDGYGQSLTCPPYAPEPKRTQAVLKEYHLALLLWKKEEYQRLRHIAAQMERTLFLAGYYKALALPAGPCELCNPCPCTYPCRHPEYARPSMEACGIDVYATVRQFGFPLEVVRSHLHCANYYALILVE